MKVVQDILIRYKRMEGIQCTVDSGNRPCGYFYRGQGYEPVKRRGNGQKRNLAVRDSLREPGSGKKSMRERLRIS